MTAIIGVICKDGVVIGADSSVTFSMGASPERTIEQQTDKIIIVDNKIIIAGTGAVGFNQRFENIITTLWYEKKLSGKSKLEAGKIISQASINDFTQTLIPEQIIRSMIPYGALVAFPLSKTFHLCEFIIGNMQPELKDDKIWYVSMGSSQHITDSILGLFREIFWTNGKPNLSEGIFATLWALELAVKLNVGGVNRPVKIATLSMIGKEAKAKILNDTELDEHLQNIEDAQQNLREWSKKLSSENHKAPDLPNI